jgi:predicted anti-sigma-YlaC factor YlaD
VAKRRAASGIEAREESMRTRRELTCRELADFLADYLEGTMARGRRDAFDAHLRGCPDCAAYLRTYAETIRLAKDACGPPDAPVPESVPEELVRVILAARSGRP